MITYFGYVGGICTDRIEAVNLKAAQGKIKRTYRPELVHLVVLVHEGGHYAAAEVESNKLYEQYRERVNGVRPCVS